VVGLLCNAMRVKVKMASKNAMLFLSSLTGFFSGVSLSSIDMNLLLMVVIAVYWGLFAPSVFFEKYLSGFDLEMLIFFLLGFTIGFFYYVFLLK